LLCAIFQGITKCANFARGAEPNECPNASLAPVHIIMSVGRLERVPQ
jgi:hypothetical protein